MDRPTPRRSRLAAAEPWLLPPLAALTLWLLLQAESSGAFEFGVMPTLAPAALSALAAWRGLKAGPPTRWGAAPEALWALVLLGAGLAVDARPPQPHAYRMAIELRLALILAALPAAAGAVSRSGRPLAWGAALLGLAVALFFLAPLAGVDLAYHDDEAPLRVAPWWLPGALGVGIGLARGRGRPVPAALPWAVVIGAGLAWLLVHGWRFHRALTRLAEPWAMPAGAWWAVARSLAFAVVAAALLGLAAGPGLRWLQRRSAAVPALAAVALAAVPVWNVLARWFVAEHT